MTNSTPWLSLTTAARAGRTLLKRYLFSQLTVISGVLVAVGKEPPLMRFTIEADPPPVYWVFTIDPTHLDALAAHLNLPPQVELCPITCLDGEEPRHYLTLNTYRVSGLSKGMRAEWSVFVKDASGAARYLIIDAKSSTWSMDPVGIVTRASAVAHQRDGDSVTTAVGGEFRARLDLAGAHESVLVSREWISANDAIYWANGVCDRTFYDAALANTPRLALAPGNYELTDTSPWREFVEPDPAHVLVVTSPVEALYHLAASPDLRDVTGTFFNRTIPEPPMPQATDRELGRRVWAVSEQFTGLGRDQSV